MNANPRGFASDNFAAPIPTLAAVADANAGHVPAYGDDPYTAAAATPPRALRRAARPFLVFNGSAANVLSLMQTARPFGAGSAPSRRTQRRRVRRARTHRRHEALHRSRTRRQAHARARRARCGAFASAISTPPSRASCRSPTRPSSEPCTRPARSARWQTSPTSAACCSTSTACGFANAPPASTSR